MRIAIPKGRLQSNALATFAAAGYDVPTEADLRTRKLVFSRAAAIRGGSDVVEWIFVKDCDVPVYVEHGAADAGVAGLDQILEHDCGAYQAVELPYGHCRMMLIGAPDAPQLANGARIATKYPRIARTYLDGRALRAEIVPLGGSVELAAVLNLTSHVIDLVETGETVRVHKLVLQDVVHEITPRLIVAKNFYRTSNQRVRELIARIEESNNVLLPNPLA
ncbi:MAG TPA: ATP phosphoribosyltransferase [Thermoanaerobaculia bacterium]|jgi:ATP phosphoribosyltransferase|nr:ATP phosphoribosyltransferase [Thermoanaerobaculia bacterium]